MADAVPLVQIRDARVSFSLRGGRRLRAVDGVSLEISRGQTLGLVGESGCGKTTLARAMVRLEFLESGSIHFDGVDVHRATGATLTRLRRAMQMVFQDPTGSLNPRLTVGASVREPLDVHRVGSRRERRERVDAMLSRVGLSPDDAARYPHQFSGGQRQRIGIARTLVIDPEFILCDEPVSALDVSVQAQVLTLLLELRRERQLTGLFIGHNLAVVRHVSDRVAVMYLGRVVELADSDALFAAPIHPYTRALRAAVPEPDPGADQPLTVLSGEPPSPADPPSGCAFHPRCPHADKECRRVTPPLRPVDLANAASIPVRDGGTMCVEGDHSSRRQGFSTRWVACHHAERLAQGIEIASEAIAGSGSI